MEVHCIDQVILRRPLHWKFTGGLYIGGSLYCPGNFKESFTLEVRCIIRVTLRGPLQWKFTVSSR